MNKNKKLKKKKGIVYTICAFFIKLFWKKPRYAGLENIPEEPCIFTGNHAQMHGPIINELYFPTDKVIWCDSPMFDKKAFPQYAYDNFFSGKPTRLQKFFVFLLKPLVVKIFNRADALPVYRDMRIVKTYKMTTDCLDKGYNVVILPECPDEFNEITNKFNEYFVDVARMYYKNTMKGLSFVPMYYCKELRIMLFGKAITFNGLAQIEDERKRICDYLMQETTLLAKSLPIHKVIPFNSTQKKYYKNSK